MLARLLVLSLLAALFSLVGCGSSKKEEQQFQANLNEAIKAAEKGKDLVQSPATKKKRR